MCRYHIADYIIYFTFKLRLHPTFHIPAVVAYIKEE